MEYTLIQVIERAGGAWGVQPREWRWRMGQRWQSHVPRREMRTESSGGVASARAVV